MPKPLSVEKKKFYNFIIQFNDAHDSCILTLLIDYRCYRQSMPAFEFSTGSVTLHIGNVSKNSVFFAVMLSI